MNNLETLFLTILIMENLTLITILYFYWTRHCKKCQQVKNIEQLFNKFCVACQPKFKEDLEDDDENED